MKTGLKFARSPRLTEFHEFKDVRIGELAGGQVMARLGRARPAGKSGKGPEEKLQRFPAQKDEQRRMGCGHRNAGYYPMMKHSRLRSIAHNLADSVGCGIGLLIGYYDMDIYAEASASSDGHITIDFLTGGITGGPASKSLSDAIDLYRAALPGFCEKHGCPSPRSKNLSCAFPGDLSAAVSRSPSETNSAAVRGPHIRVLPHDG